jgi:glycerol kinase
VRDVLETMPPVELLRADGGMTRNRWLMQFQADVLGVPVETAREPEQTAFGAALLALGERRASRASSRAVRSRAPCSSPAPRCSGSATASRSSTTPT